MPFKWALDGPADDGNTAFLLMDGKDVGNLSVTEFSPGLIQPVFLSGGEPAMAGKLDGFSIDTKYLIGPVGKGSIVMHGG